MTKTETPEPVELDDVQGIIMKGYSSLKEAKFLMLNIGDAAKAKHWLSNQLALITIASTSAQHISSAINISFTYSGIAAFGVDSKTLETFPEEFIEGIISEHRSRMLGDLDDSHPSKWDWGSNKETKKIHLVLMIYATDATTLEHLYTTEKTKWEAAKLELLYQLDTNNLPDQKEHFGFRDGIAQPDVKDTNHFLYSDANAINPGEFLFGYRNEYSKYTFSPTVNPANDPLNILSNDKNNSELKDLGRNGSMLVFRQLEQNVKAFWEMADAAAKKHTLEYGETTPEYIASKMVGRWPDGRPLTKCPFPHDELPKPELDSSGNPTTIPMDNFGYAKDDYDGAKCPIGSHIRRSNSRDNFLRDSTGKPEKDIEKSIKFMKRFRILRRGRYYGEPLVSTMNPQDMIKTADDGKKRGIYFLCFNSNIERQFELIQQTWINNPKFAGLYNDPDPLTGDPAILGKNATSTFTIQDTPVRKQVEGITRFVNVKGGAYFFMPGIKALRYLSSI